MKRVFVTGANGLLGQAVVEKFRHDHELIASDMAPRYLGSGPAPQGYFRLDITDRAAVIRIMNEVKPDIIINAAAYTDVDGCEQDRERCWNVNVKSLEMLTEAVSSFKPLFVHISTDYVFDGKSGPYRESDKTQPLGYYGLTKLSSEKVVRGCNLEYIIGRTMILYGVGEGIRPNFFTWVHDQLSNNRRIKVVNDQLGNPTLSDDLAEALYRLIEREQYGLYHIAGNEICSRYEFSRKIADIFKLDASLIEEVTTADLKQKAPRPMNAAFVLDKLANAVDWLPSGVEPALMRLKERMQ